MVSPTQLGSNRGGASQKNKSSFRIVMFCSVYLMMKEVRTPSYLSGIKCLSAEHIVTTDAKEKNNTNLTRRILPKQSGCVECYQYRPSIWWTVHVNIVTNKHKKQYSCN
jgi:hypothetical protein